MFGHRPAVWLQFQWQIWIVYKGYPFVAILWCDANQQLHVHHHQHPMYQLCRDRWPVHSLSWSIRPEWVWVEFSIKKMIKVNSLSTNHNWQITWNLFDPSIVFMRFTRFNCLRCWSLRFVEWISHNSIDWPADPCNVAIFNSLNSHFYLSILGMLIIIVNNAH